MTCSASVAARRRLLYVSPTVPRETGNGLAMRAGAVLKALARHHDVLLLVVPLYGPRNLDAMPSGLRGACRAIHLVEAETRENERTDDQQGAVTDPERVFAAWRKNAAQAYAGQRLDVVHAFRLSMLPYARTYFGSDSGDRPERHLDLDDVESITHRRLAERARLNGERERASRYEGLAERYDLLEQLALRIFDRIHVCSEADRDVFQGRGSAAIDVLPNTVEIPLAAASPPDGTFRFLFLGTLSYYPNEDAVSWFAKEVLPRLRRHAPAPFTVEIAGRGATSSALRVHETPEIVLTGEVPSVAPLYQRASAAIVPVRAGGGTRIKVLEAFAHRRPVIATGMGVQGIDARHEEHLLIADDPDLFAVHCARLMSDVSLRERLTASAFRLVNDAHSPAALDAVVDRLFTRAAVPAPGAPAARLST